MASSSDPIAQPRECRSAPFRGALVLFSGALLVRIGAVLAFDAWHAVDKGAWGFGFEAACIARSLHEGAGFAGPWTRPELPWSAGSGATAWLSPAYPAWIALLMSVFGGLVPSMAFVLFLVQGVVSALTCVALARLGAALGASRAGRVAGWVLAFYPASVWNASAVVWDTTFVAFGLVVLMWAAVACARARVRTWAAIGAGFGALLLLNPAPLALVPAVLWPAWRARASIPDFARRLAVFTVMCLIVILPWMLRNQRMLGHLTLRTNLGVELAVGNNDDANGRFQITHHPSNSGVEFERYRQMGEVPYAAWAKAEALRWIAAHPVRFLDLCAHRALYFWLGEDPITDPRTDERGIAAAADVRSWIKFIFFAIVGVVGLAGAIRWARREFAGRVLLLVLLLFPLAYYVTHVLERYRYPIEPFLVLAGVWMILDLRKERQGVSLSSRA